MTRDKNHTQQTIVHAICALALIPPGASAMALMRHAERYGMTKGHHGNDILLTPQGKKDSTEMGRLFRGHVCGLRHSPVPRCMQTAECMCESADCPVSQEWLPLRCDVFVDDFDSALPTLRRLLSENGFYERFVGKMSTSAEPPYPHFKHPLKAAAELTAKSLIGSGICVNITHDWLVNVTASRASGQETKRPDYAGYLDALFLWKESGQAMFYYKGKTGPCAPDFVRELVAACDRYVTQQG